jgi:hypothetical protein
MAKQSSPAERKEAVIALDTELVDNIGSRVFYSDPKLGKCLALVTGYPGGRSPVARNEHENIVSGGQTLFQLDVFHNNMGPNFKVLATYSSDGAHGTFRLMTDGDTGDPVNQKPHTEQPGGFEQEVPQEGGNTVTQGTGVPEFDPADENQDGSVDKGERKRFNRKS